MIFGKHINKFYKRYWYLFLGVFLSDAIVDIIQLMIPLIIGNVISAFTNEEVQSGVYRFSYLRPFTGFQGGFQTIQTNSIPFHQTDFFITILTILLIGLIIFFGRMGWRFFSAQIGSRIERDLRDEMFAHIQTMSLSYYNQKKVGGLLSFFTNDLATIKQCFSEALIWVTDLTVLGTLSFTFMAILSYQLALYTAIPLLLFIVLGGIIGKFEAKKYKISNDAFENLSDFTEENLQGFSVIKSFLKVKSRIKSFKKLSYETKTTNVDYLRYSSLIDLAINLLLAVTFFILYFLGAMSILDKNVPFAGQITDIGKLSTFVGYYDSLIWPMIAGGMLIDMVSRGSGARKRIAEILDCKPDIVDENNAKRDSIHGDVEFNHLTFTYPDGKVPALKDISFHVTPGMTVGIIGKTGSGKSTLVSLLPKLYNLPQGMLRIDGVDINDWRKSDLREHCGYVLQEGFLYSGTISENIAFSEPRLDEYDMEKVRNSAKFANVDNDIQSFLNGYDTIVEEKGATLSGGQRQRVSIARAIYKNPQMLILDDSLSAVDADTEKSILENIRTREDKLTTFIIAHRISAIENADLILVLDHGELVGKGKHAELYESCRLYHDLCELQQLEKEVN
jgi:ATP-binding cassette, subfamily B, multidrug efflux pump